MKKFRMSRLTRRAEGRSPTARKTLAREEAGRGYLTQQEIAEVLELPLQDVPECETLEQQLARIKSMTKEEQDALRLMDLPLHGNVINPLLQFGETLGDVFSHSPEEIRTARGFGHTNWEEFRTFVEALKRFVPASFS